MVNQTKEIGHLKRDKALCHNCRHSLHDEVLDLEEFSIGLNEWANTTIREQSDASFFDIQLSPIVPSKQN